MASTTESGKDSVQQHMARLRMKIVQQKIANEKDRILQRPTSEESNNNDLDNQVRLQQAMLRRQELLDNLRRQQLMNDEDKRPRTHSPRRRYTPSPLPGPPSRLSLPELAARNDYLYGPQTYRAQPDMSTRRHVIEHRLVQTPKPYHLPPIQNPPQPMQQQQQGPLPIQMQQPPPPQIVQPPAPQIIQAPPQQVIAAMPNPVIHNLGASNDHKGMFNKADFMEMMMMQNAQMHHYVMQQMMLNAMPGMSVNNRVPVAVAADTISPGVVTVPKSSAVHHHHYSSPPPQSQPVVHHYTQMPQMELRGGYPLRGYASYYTSPGYYMYDEGLSNYYVYH